MERGVKIIGTDCDAIERAENRDAFEKILLSLGIPQPKGEAVTNIEDGVAAAAEIGYPVLVRPSFVLGGRAMQIVANEEQLRHYLKTAVEIDEDKPVLVDKYIQGKEVEVDAICDGRDVFVPGIMELVERTGVHSGDSISVYPAFSISDKVKGIILQYAKKLGLGIGIVGLYNIQFIVDRDENVYIIEVNPRSSRTVPFLSKATGYSLADIATEVILGKSLKEQGIFDLYPEEKKRYYVKVPVFSFNKIKGLDAYLSPEMKSTGEAIGYDDKLNRALYKALQAAGMHLQNYGTVFATIADKDKEEALPLIRRFYNLGFNIEATEGTAQFLKEHGIRTHVLKKISEDSDEIPDALRQGHIAYVINTRDLGSTEGTRRPPDPPVRHREQRDHVHLAGYRPRAAGRAGGDHADHLHHRRLRPGRRGSDHPRNKFPSRKAQPTDGRLRTVRLRATPCKGDSSAITARAVCQRPAGRPVSPAAHLRLRREDDALTLVYKVGVRARTQMAA